MKKFVISLLLVFNISAHADTIMLRDGTRFEAATVESEGEDVVVLKTKYGVLNINKADILTQVKSEPVAMPVSSPENISISTVPLQPPGDNKSIVTTRTLPLARGERINFYLNNKYIARLNLDDDFNVLSQEGVVPDGMVKIYATDGKLEKEIGFIGNKVISLKVYTANGILESNGFNNIRRQAVKVPMKKPVKFVIVGYTGSFPQIPLGINVFSFREDGWGIYADFKGNFGPPTDETYDSVSVNKAENIFNDTLLKKKDFWKTLNIGFSRLLINRKIALYGGMGYSWASNYRQYHDEFEILGSNGNYWVADESADKSGVNFLTGILFFLSDQVSANVGVSSKPYGVDVGLGWMFGK